MSMDVYCLIVFLIGIIASVIVARIDRAEQDSLDKAAVLIWLIIIATLSFIGSIGYVLTKLIQS
jgi:hypothetical protein